MRISDWSSDVCSSDLRVKKVYVQADDPFRKAPEDLERWYVRGGAGEMTPLSTFASTRWNFGPTRLERYNGLPSYEILGEPAPGKSSGAAMKALERIRSEEHTSELQSLMRSAYAVFCSAEK